MDKQKSDMIKLIYSGITNKSIDTSELGNYETLINVASKHHCITMLYYAFNNNKITLKNELRDAVEKVVLNEVVLNEQQLYFIDELSRVFNENGIEHIFLKGSVLKKLYPYSEIRRMGDIDILIKEAQYQEISKIMQKIGYSFEYESDYEIVWKKGYTHIELHRVLIPAYNKDLYEYFGDGWKRAIVKEQNSYTFSEEDMFIYIFSHFAKHYRDAGIGIIHICDLYVLLNSYNLDFKYINTELKKLHLYDFWCNIKATIDVWFFGGKSTDITDYITNVIFNSGVYGLKEKSNISKALKSKKKYGNLLRGKLFRIFSCVFPPYSSMKRKYKTLKKIPVLLPAFWIWRWISLFFTRPQKIKIVLSNISNIDESEVTEYQKQLKYVGLDYNF